MTFILIQELHGRFLHAANQFRQKTYYVPGVRISTLLLFVHCSVGVDEKMLHFSLVIYANIRGGGDVNVLLLVFTTDLVWLQ